METLCEYFDPFLSSAYRFTTHMLQANLILKLSNQRYHVQISRQDSTYCACMQLAAVLPQEQTALILRRRDCSLIPLYTSQDMITRWHYLIIQLVGNFISSTRVHNFGWCSPYWLCLCLGEVLYRVRRYIAQVDVQRCRCCLEV